MNNRQFKIVFQGELFPGFTIADVKKSLKQRFNIDAIRLEQLFSGATVVLKNNISIEQAIEHHERFKSLGLQTYIKETIEATIAVNTPVNKAIIATKSSPEIIKTTANFSQNKINYSSNVLIKAPPIWGLNCSGRYGRLNFIFASLIIFVVSFGINSMFASSVAATSNRPGLGLVIFNLLLTFILLLFCLRIIILRLHDIDKSAWWLLLLIPSLCYMLLFLQVLAIFNTYYYLPILASEWVKSLLIYIMLPTILLMLIPGTISENRYGLPVEPAELIVIIALLFSCFIISIPFMWAFVLTWGNYAH